MKSINFVATSIRMEPVVSGSRSRASLSTQSTGTLSTLYDKTENDMRADISKGLQRIPERRDAVDKVVGGS